MPWYFSIGSSLDFHTHYFFVLYLHYQESNVANVFSILKLSLPDSLLFLGRLVFSDASPYYFSLLLFLITFPPWVQWQRKQCEYRQAGGCGTSLATGCDFLAATPSPQFTTPSTCPPYRPYPVWLRKSVLERCLAGLFSFVLETFCPWVASFIVTKTPRTCRSNLI